MFCLIAASPPTPAECHFNVHCLQSNTMPRACDTSNSPSAVSRATSGCTRGCRQLSTWPVQRTCAHKLGQTLQTQEIKADRCTVQSPHYVRTTTGGSALLMGPIWGTPALPQLLLLPRATDKERLRRPLAPTEPSAVATRVGGAEPPDTTPEPLAVDCSGTPTTASPTASTSVTVPPSIMAKGDDRAKSDRIEWPEPA